MKDSKKFSFVSVITVSLLCVVSPVYGGSREDFETHCLKCHGESAPPIYPADRLKEQWKEFFRKRFDKIHNPKKVKIAPEVLRRIEEYVETYSADSDQPEGATF